MAVKTTDDGRQTDDISLAEAPLQLAAPAPNIILRVSKDIDIKLLVGCQDQDGVLRHHKCAV